MKLRVFAQRLVNQTKSRMFKNLTEAQYKLIDDKSYFPEAVVVTPPLLSSPSDSQQQQKKPNQQSNTLLLAQKKLTSDYDDKYVRRVRTYTIQGKK